MTREYCIDHGYQDFFEGAIPDEPHSEALFCPLCWPDHTDNPNHQEHSVTNSTTTALTPDGATYYRLRVSGAGDYQVHAAVRFLGEDLMQLATLKGVVERLAINAPHFESLSLWNTFQVLWIEEQFDIDDDVDGSDSAVDVARVSEAHYDPNSDSVMRTEYDVVQFDKHGVTFRSDMRHTDLTMSTSTIEWGELLGAVVAEPEPAPAPGLGAVEIIAQAIAETGASPSFNAAAALAAIGEVRSNLRLMEQEVNRIVARKLPS